jgi:hypothetical protein
MFSSGKLSGFFNSQANIQDATRKEVMRGFQDNEGFSTIPKNQTYGTLYKLSPFAADPNTKVSPQQFRDLNPQAAANHVWGFDSKDPKKPNYTLPEAYINNVDKENMARKGVLFEPAKPFNFEHSSPILRNFDAHAKGYNSPGAQAGIDMSKPLRTTDGMNPINPNRVNGTQLTTYDPIGNTYATVADSHGVPSAGATPSGSKAPEAKDAVKRKYNFTDDEMNGFMGAFAPIGSN